MSNLSRAGGKPQGAKGLSYATHPSDAPHPSDTSNILFISHPITINMDIHHLVLYLNMIQVFFE
jgi:hypothetical protein